MSEIDSIQHSHIGYFCNIPVYHPITNESDFSSDSIIIGGGSGEHPMFIIENLDNCLLNYIEYFSEEYFGVDVDYISDWGIQISFDIYPRIKKIMEKYEINSPEKAIILSVGSFIKDHGKHLVSSKTWEKSQALNLPSVKGIVLEKENPYGKIIIDGEVVWGISFFDEKKYTNIF